MNLTEIILISVVALATIFVLLLNNKNKEKIKKQEENKKKAKKEETANPVQREEISASDFSEKVLKEDNYLHKMFNTDKDTSIIENKRSHSPSDRGKRMTFPTTSNTVTDLDLDEDEGVFDDADFEAMFNSEDFGDDDFNISIDENSNKKHGSLAEEFSSLSDDMKKMIITNVLNDKKGDE